MLLQQSMRRILAMRGCDEQVSSSEEKYSLSDFNEALTDWLNHSAPMKRDEHIIDFLKKKYDPEYQQYLMLKTKFEKS